MFRLRIKRMSYHIIDYLLQIQNIKLIFLQPDPEKLEEAHILFNLKENLFLFDNPMIMLDDIWIFLFADIGYIQVHFEFELLADSLNKEVLRVFAVAKLVDVAKRYFFFSWLPTCFILGYVC